MILNEIVIRKAVKSDFTVLREIELSAFATLRAAGAASGPATAVGDIQLARYLNSTLLFVATDENNRPVGFAGGLSDRNWLHIAEMDVHPQWQRQGIGRRLIAALLDAGRAQNLTGAWLTTDRFAPFNAPFYRSAGFAIADGEACSARLRAILAAEAAQGFDPLRRVAMTLQF